MMICAQIVTWLMQKNDFGTDRQTDIQTHSVQPDAVENRTRS